MKTCTKCKTEKPESDFYYNACQKCFRTSCKKCDLLYKKKFNSTSVGKNYRKQYYFLNRDKWLPIMKEYDKSTRGKEVRHKSKRKTAPLHILEQRTRYITRCYIKTGKLAKLACEVCGNFLSEVHHTDYTNPMAVVFLCRKHHRKADSELWKRHAFYD